MNNIDSDELYPDELPQDLIEEFIPSPEEIMASRGVCGTRMAWSETAGFDLPGRIYASTTNCEFHDMLKEVRDNIESYKLAKAPPAYIPNGAYQAPYAKASPGELAAIEHAIAILEQQAEKLIRAFRLGAKSVREATAIRYCLDCGPEDRRPLRPRRRYRDKHRAERRNRTYSRINAKRHTTATTALPREGKLEMMNEKENLNPVEATRREIVRLMDEEKLSVYDAAKKLGIVREQVISWRLKDKEFRLMIRAAGMVKMIEMAEKAIALQNSGRPLHKGEQLFIKYVAQIPSPEMLDTYLNLEEGSPR
jgi:hypothetical protein